MSDLHTPAVRSSVAGDWHAVCQMLVDAGLPVEDLEPAMLDDFLIAEAKGSIVGAIGLQIFDSIGLLRSLVVVKHARKSGLGRQLLYELQAAAKLAGITDLWLLTIDADTFFARHGFVVMPRERVPTCIANTAEFQKLCPHDAHLMSKSLA